MRMVQEWCALERLASGIETFALKHDLCHTAQSQIAVSISKTDSNKKSAREQASKKRRLQTAEKSEITGVKKD